VCATPGFTINTGDRYLWQPVLSCLSDAERIPPSAMRDATGKGQIQAMPSHPGLSLRLSDSEERRMAFMRWLADELELAGAREEALRQEQRNGPRCSAEGSAGTGC